MKLALFATVSASIVKRNDSQLTDLMKHYNSEFDEQKYWTYGCNCWMSSTQMPESGFGRPVDPLDHACKKYRDCIKCAKMTHGEMCIGESVMVRFMAQLKNSVKAEWHDITRNVWESLPDYPFGMSFKCSHEKNPKTCF